MREYAERLKLNKFVLDTLGEMGIDIKKPEDDIYSIVIPSKYSRYFGGRRYFEFTFDQQMYESREGLEYIFWGSSFLNQLIEIVREKSTCSCRCYRHEKEITDKYRGKPLITIKNANLEDLSQRIDYQRILKVLIKITITSSGKREEVFTVNINLDNYEIINNEMRCDGNYQDITLSDLALSDLNICFAVDIGEKSNIKHNAQYLMEGLGKSVRLLGNRDAFSLLTFANEAHTVVTTRKNNNDRLIFNKFGNLENISSDGSSKFFPAIVRGSGILKKFSSSGIKNHLIIVTSSKINDYSDCRNFIKNSSSNISISIVGIGDKTDCHHLESIASISGGSFIHIDNINKVVKVISKLTNKLKSSSSSPFFGGMNLSPDEIEKAMETGLQHTERLCYPIINEENQKANQKAEIEIDKYKKYARCINLDRDEQKRKIANIKRKYALNVEFNPISCCIAFIPTLVTNHKFMHSKAGLMEKEATVELLSDRVMYPHCTVCGIETSVFYLCEYNGHLICEGDVMKCDVCGEIRCNLHPLIECTTLNCCKKICEQCRIECENCGNIVCSDCVKICTYSNERICNDCVVECQHMGCYHHISKRIASECNICGKILCPDHRRTCPICQETVCETHYVTCSEGHKTGECCGVYCSECGVFVCNEHKIRCSDCGEYFCPGCVKKCGMSGKTNEFGMSVKEHYVCLRDVVQCSVCQTELCKKHANICKDCGAVVCPLHSEECIICGKVNCLNCLNECSYCKGKICSDHLFTCSYKNCGKINCSIHTKRCATCGNDFCVEHSIKCIVCNDNICLDCALECASCGEKVCSDHIKKCELCGKKICENCIVTCSICGKSVCRDHTCECCVGKEPICSDCTYLCHIDNSPVCGAHATVCPICNEKVCHIHSFTCRNIQCGKRICTIHQVTCSVCNKNFCPDCINECSIDNVKICKDDTFTCPCCFKKAGKQHIETCKLCGQDYISTCIDDEGICRICNNLHPISKKDESIHSIIEDLPFIEKILSYKYMASEKGDFIVITYGYFFKRQILVYDKRKKLILKKSSL